MSPATPGSELERLEGAGYSCLVAPPVRAGLAALLERGDPSTWPGFEPIKSSTVRTVLRGVLPGERTPAVHLKIYRAVRLSDRARDAAWGSRAAREMRHLLAARARGLPAIEPLATGVLRGSAGSRSFLLTRTAEGEPLPRGPLPQDVARAAGELLRRVHDRGLRAHDLHPGNVLRARDGSLLLLDLTSARLGDPLGPAERARALARFCADLDAGPAHPAARPVLEGYGADPALRARAIRAGRRLRRRGLAAFGRRATRRCRHTEVIRDPDGSVWFLRKDQSEWHDRARRLIASPPPPIKSGRRGSVHLDEHLVLKDRPAAAARALLRACYWLEFAGVPHPEPVALRLWRGRGRLVLRRLPRPTLAEEIDKLSRPERRAAARQLGAAVGRLHAHGLRNRDLKLENLVRDPKSGVVHMVDLDGIRRKATLDPRGLAADLGRLLAAARAAGAADDLRVLGAFLRGYHAARSCLLAPRINRYQRRLIAARASAWASAHANTATP